MINADVGLNLAIRIDHNIDVVYQMVMYFGLYGVYRVLDTLVYWIFI